MPLVAHFSMPVQDLQKMAELPSMTGNPVLPWSVVAHANAEMRILLLAAK
jgi:hypothetical protein